MNTDLTVGDIANWMRVDVQAVRRWIRSGNLASRREGHTYLISHASLVAFLDHDDSHQESTMAAGRRPKLPDLYTFEEIADTYGYSLRKMQDDARAGKFVHIHRGHAWRMTPEQLEAFQALHTRNAEAGADPLAGVRERRSRRQNRRSQTRAA